MQAGVTVLDSRGRPVEDLTADQFEVRVDGKPQTVSFFERVTAGSAEERAKLAAARGAKPTHAAGANAAGLLPDQGRVVVFFLDDLHMSSENITRARKAVEHFIEKEMGQNDVAAVATASGQLGFLQQLTQNRNVLRAAVSRLRPWPQTVVDNQLPRMTEFLARAIDVENDRDVLETYVQALMKEDIKRPMAESITRGRARAILQAANAATRNTLRSLRSLVRTLSPLPGRKLVFFVSDGFFLNRSDTDVSESLREITDAAVRSGFVLYTLDSRGLATDPWVDAVEPLPADGTGQLLRATRSEMSASQEALHQLAEETGGRALLNTNATARVLTGAVRETASYYVLAWRPTDYEPRGGKFRELEVSVKGRPDLIVLVQRGFLEGAGAARTAAATGTGKGKKDSPGSELQAALAAALPARGLPAHLSLGYASEQKGEYVLTALLSVPLDALSFDAARAAALELEGYVVNLDGKVGSRFRERVSLTAARQHAGVGGGGHVLYRHQIKLAPGIYQVRAAARDAVGGRVGSAAEWIEIPDLKSGGLTLGSIVLGERPAETGAPPNAENFVSQQSAERRFARDSHLRFMAYIYNAARPRPADPPDLTLQIQVLRDGRPVFTDEWRKVDGSAAEPGRVAYGGELDLATVRPGRYVLRLTVRDRVAKTEASQDAPFTVE